MPFTAELAVVLLRTLLMHLVNTKCLSILLYYIESCPLLSRDVQSLDFSVNRVIMKVFRTGSSTLLMNAVTFSVCCQWLIL